jgi:hypothetical protein
VRTSPTIWSCSSSTRAPLEAARGTRSAIPDAIRAMSAFACATETPGFSSPTVLKYDTSRICVMSPSMSMGGIGTGLFETNQARAFCGTSNAAGMTPTIVCGRPLMRTSRPMTAGSDPSRSRHRAWPSTTRGSLLPSPAAVLNVRPRTAGMPKTSKNSTVTSAPVTPMGSLPATAIVVGSSR